MMANATYTLVKTVGLTEIYQSRNSILVTHAGNSGSTEDNVRDNFDWLFGKGRYERLRADVRSVATGSPDYYFTLEIPRKTFDSCIFDHSYLNF
jgi:hypothetical protein